MVDTKRFGLHRVEEKRMCNVAGPYAQKMNKW